MVGTRCDTLRIAVKGLQDESWSDNMMAHLLDLSCKSITAAVRGKNTERVFGERTELGDGVAPTLTLDADGLIGNALLRKIGRERLRGLVKNKKVHYFSILSIVFTVWGWGGGELRAEKSVEQRLS